MCTRNTTRKIEREKNKKQIQAKPKARQQQKTTPLTIQRRKIRNPSKNIRKSH
jgi:hypothetical protein